MLAYVDHGPLQHLLACGMIFVWVNYVLCSRDFDGLNQIVLVVIDVDVPEEAEVVGGAQPLEVDPEDDDGEPDEPEGQEEDVGCDAQEDCQELQDVVGGKGGMAEEEATEEGGQLKRELGSVVTYQGEMGDTLDVIETRVYVGPVLVQELHLYYQEGDEEYCLL